MEGEAEKKKGSKQNLWLLKPNKHHSINLAVDIKVSVTLKCLEILFKLPFLTIAFEIHSPGLM